MTCPKTGSTTIRKWLQVHCDGKVWTFDGLEFVGFYGHVCHLPEKFKDYFVFTVVRNPYRLIVSRYNFFKPKHFSKLTFDEYVQRSSTNTLYKKLHQNNDYIPPKGYVPYKINRFLKLEHLKKDLLSLPFVDNVNGIEHANRTGNPNQVYFTKELVEIVKKGMADDFCHFKYSTKCPIELTKLKLF